MELGIGHFLGKDDSTSIIYQQYGEKIKCRLYISHTKTVMFHSFFQFIKQVVAKMYFKNSFFLLVNALKKGLFSVYSKKN